MKVSISPSQPSCPALLYGTAWKKEATARLVESALALGFRGVDTACQPKHYDEAGVGVGIAASLGRGLGRHELYVQTKFTPIEGQDPKRLPYDRAAPIGEQVAQSCARSLENLRVSYLDALLLHSPISPARKLLEAWQAMEAAVDAGHVRALGISNFYQVEQLSALWRAARIAPSVVQNRFSARTGYDAEIRAFCAAHGARYQSFWTLTGNPHVLGHADLRAIATRHAATPAQVFFRYLTLLGISVLSGTCSEQHMQDDVSLFRLALTEPELAAITRLLERPAKRDP